MSDFLSHAINERLEEKRMETEKRLKEAAEVAKWEQIKVIYKEQIRDLFLDTIEKAKPKKADATPKTLEEAEYLDRHHMTPDVHAVNAYNAAIDDYEANLKKEIGK